LNTIIIGGGNSAIDAARTAWRIAPEGGSVSLVYRRTEREMPADYEEILELREEKIPVLELLAPVELVYNDGDLFGLKCQQMSLSQKDESGRARPVPVDGAFTTIPANLIIAAIGQDSDLDFLRESPIETTRWGTVIVDSSGRTPASESVYSGGDVVHGPQSIIQAVADGKEAAWAIFQKEGIPLPDLSGSDRVPHAEDIRTMRARRNAGESIPRTSPLERKNFTVVGTGFSETAAKNEAARCLACDVLCEVCVTVCPNRANLSWYSGEVNFTIRDIFLTHGSMSFGEPVKFIISQTPQVLNIGDFCNECGNCTTFCPTSGRPFADKAKFYLDRAAFEKESDTAWHLIREDETHTILHGDSGHIFALSGEAGKEFFQLGVNDVVLHLSRQDLSISHIETGAEDLTIPMEKVASMAVFLESSLNDMLGL
ncbi:FAD-dependent oxidoreductase, partial [Myxococcota bacterium]|nr:FAD-dependent oxidoreductase [Myxococcota bacterium]